MHGGGPATLASWLQLVFWVMKWICRLQKGTKTIEPSMILKYKPTNVIQSISHMEHIQGGAYQVISTFDIMKMINQIENRYMDVNFGLNTVLHNIYMHVAHTRCRGQMVQRKMTKWSSDIRLCLHVLGSGQKVVLSQGEIEITLNIPYFFVISIHCHIATT